MSPELVRGEHPVRDQEAHGPRVVGDHLHRDIVFGALPVGSAAELFDLRGLEIASAGPVPPRLLPMWDSVLLAYADRRRVIPERHRAHVIRRNGDVLPTLLVDGHVAGVWRFRDGRIEAAAFEPLAREDWSGLEDEAAALAPLVAERDPGLFGRYRRWWDQLPAVETRLLSG